MNTFKRSIILLIISFCALSAYSQTSQKESEAYKLNKKVYEQGVKYNDIGVAKDALYRLIALDPNDISLLDSLAYLYFENSKFISSIMVCKDILAKNPNSLSALELSAVSLQNIGLKDKALAEYETLYLKNNDINTLYQIAFLQFDLKRFNESKTSVDIILGNKTLDSLKVVHGTSQKTQQEVPMKASVLNLKGLIDFETGNKTEAKKHFEEALKIAPEFEHPKENLKKVG